jgi:hypothetical protein
MKVVKSGFYSESLDNAISSFYIKAIFILNT